MCLYGCHNIVGDQRVVSVGAKLNLGIQEELSHQQKWTLLLNCSGILVMATNLNKTNSDYYSVQQDDSLLVKSFEFPKISWNRVSKEHVGLLQLISRSKGCGILKLIQGIVWQKWLKITCVLQGSASPNSYGNLQCHLEWAKCLILEVFELSSQAHKSFFWPKWQLQWPHCLNLDDVCSFWAPKTSEKGWEPQSSQG